MLLVRIILGVIRFIRALKKHGLEKIGCCYYRFGFTCLKLSSGFKLTFCQVSCS